MAKQDDVDPVDEPGTTGPFEAADDRTGSSTDAVAASAPNDSGEVGGSPERPDLVDPVDRLEGDLVDDDPVEDDPEDAEHVDEFDEFVRSSDVPHADDEPDEEPAELRENGDAGEAKVLEPAGVAATTAGGRTAAERASRRTPKGVATAKRDRPAKRERTTPAKFVRQSVGELRKVVYPTGQQLINYFIVVLVFVLFVIAYVSLLDLGFGAAIFRLFS